jgi:hypothetical protein
MRGLSLAHGHAVQRAAVPMPAATERCAKKSTKRRTRANSSLVLE